MAARQGTALRCLGPGRRRAALSALLSSFMDGKEGQGGGEVENSTGCRTEATSPSDIRAACASAATCELAERARRAQGEPEQPREVAVQRHQQASPGAAQNSSSKGPSPIGTSTLDQGTRARSVHRSPSRLGRLCRSSERAGDGRQHAARSHILYVPRLCCPCGPAFARPGRRTLLIVTDTMADHSQKRGGHGMESAALLCPSLGAATRGCEASKRRTRGQTGIFQDSDTGSRDPFACLPACSWVYPGTAGERSPGTERAGEVCSLLAARVVPRSLQPDRAGTVTTPGRSWLLTGGAKTSAPMSGGTSACGHSQR